MKELMLIAALCVICLQSVHAQNMDNTQLTSKEIMLIKKNGFVPKELLGKNFTATGKSYGKQGDFAAWFQGKNINTWCSSISGNLMLGKKQSVSGNLEDYSQDHDRTGNFFLKDCVIN